MTEDQKNPAEQALVVIQPAQELEQFNSERKDIRAFIKKEMKEDVDFGVIPGTKKKTLYQPGAEKLAKFFGLGPMFTLTKEIEDWEKGFFYYRYKCELRHLASSKFIGDTERSCNSKEKKYSQYTVGEKWATEDQKQRIVDRFQNDRGYPTLKIKKSPDESANDVNTIQAMAQKRALVACVRTATMASDFFENDISDGEVGPTNQNADPTRVNQIKKLHAVARPRGFDEDKLHKTIEALYKVTSITDLTGQQIHELTEKLMEYDIVKNGDPPKRRAAS